MFCSPFGVITPVEKTDYDAMGNAIVKINANGHITKISYTTRGQPYQTEYPDGSIEQKEYSLSGLLIKEIAKNGLITTYTYDPFDRIIATHVIDPQGTLLKTKTATYSTFHLLTETDEESIITRYEYDWTGRRTAMIKQDHVTRYEYDTLGRIVKTIDSIDETNVRITCKSYDLLDRVIEERIEDQHGEVFKHELYSYDVNGNKTSTTIFTQAGTSKTTTEYLPNGKPSCMTDPLGNQTRYFYNHAFSYKGQTVLYDLKVDPMGNREQKFYDTHGNVCYQAQIDPLGSFIQKEFSYYDPLGHKIQSEISVFQGNTEKGVIGTRWEYDSMGNMFRCTEAVGTPEQKIVKHDFNLHGQKEATHMPKGFSIINKYDSLGRLSSYRSTDNIIHYRYTYDVKDRPTLIEDLVNQTETKRTYDHHGCLKSETLGNNLTLFYTYDHLDRPTTVTLPDKSAIHYHFNANYLASVDRIRDNKVVYTHRYNYDLAGNITEQTLLGQAGKIHYQYDLLERPISLQAPHWRMTIPSEGFDAVGNLLEREVTDALGTLTYTYAYDHLYQLISENGFVSHTYQNDSVYNRTAKNDQHYDVNALNQLVSQTNCSYIYDNNGNLIEKTADNQTVRYVYDALDRLIEVHQGPNITYYTYDSFHRRLSKTQNGLTTQYLYQNQKEVGAVNQGKINQLRILGLSEIGGAIAHELNGKTYVPIHDPQGSIVALLDPSGNLVESYRYTAFGETQLLTAVDNPWRYSSKRFDPETGFIFFGRRYYDPEIGRWTTSDPAGYADGPNLYAYVHNKPLICIDPDGRFSFQLCNILFHLAFNTEKGRCISGAVGHGILDFTMSNIHAFEQGFTYIGSDDLGFSLESRVVMFNELSQRQADRMSTMSKLVMDAQGINHNDPLYNNVRHGTSLGLEVASLAGGAYSLGKGALSLARGAMSLPRFSSASNLTSSGRISRFSIGNDTRLLYLKRFDRATQVSSEILQNNQKIASQIAQGHAFEKHVLMQGEFPGWIRTRKQFAEHIENVLNNPTQTKALNNDRIGFWHQETGTVIIRNPKDPDGGTAFQPKTGINYYEDRLK